MRRLRRRLVWEAEASVGVDFKWRACVVDCELCGAGVYVCARRVCIVCARISGCAPSAMWVLTRLVEDTTCMCGDWCGASNECKCRGAAAGCRQRCGGQRELGARAIEAARRAGRV